MMTWLLRLGPTLSLLGLWQLITMAGGWVFFPPPSKILVRLYENWFSGPASSLFVTPQFWADVVPSVGRALAGLAIAIVVGVALGVVAGQWSSAAAYIDPPVNFMRSLPKPAIVPIFLLVLGASDGMRIGLIAFGCIWPILLNTMQGVRSVDPAYRETATAFHIPTAVSFFRVILPAASPKIAAGVRVSLSLALILMVLSEWMLAQNGLGYFLINAQRTFRVLDLWSAIVLLGLIGYGLNVAFLAVEHRLLGWHRATSLQS
jgi:ABC-type nitrate/sulfonate/bicarbonate transport system permease component